VFAVGLAAALVASALFNVGIALQGIEARSTPKKLGLSVSLLTLLFRRKRWVLGWVLGVVGIAPQVLAFADAPFVVVQPALASGLLILLFIGSRMFGEHVDWVEILGVSAIIGGVALLAWGAPQHAETHRSGAAVVAVVAGLAAAGFFPFVVRGTRWDTGMGSIVSGLRSEQRRDQAPERRHRQRALRRRLDLGGGWSHHRHRCDDHRHDRVSAAACDNRRPGQHRRADLSADCLGALLPPRALDLCQVWRRADRRWPPDRARRNGRRLADAGRQ
jgi:multidrug transporter EmrE-like cation transporter